MIRRSSDAEFKIFLYVYARAKRTLPYNDYQSNPPYAWDVIHDALIGTGQFLRELSDLENEQIPQQYCAARNNVLLQAMSIATI